MRNLYTFSTFLLIFAIFYCIDGQAARPAFCELPQDGGQGENLRIYLYYNKTLDKCFPFRFYGEGGNNNRFIAEHICMRNCSSRAESLYPKKRSAACHFPKASGECFNNYIRYYYDPVMQKCKTFFWTGCVGNGNRFLDARSCNETCFGELENEDDVSDGEDESDTPVGIILGVILGIIGVIIIIIVVVLALQKPSPKKSKAKAKEDKKSSRDASDKPLKDEKIEMA